VSAGERTATADPTDESRPASEGQSPQIIPSRRSLPPAIDRITGSATFGEQSVNAASVPGHELTASQSAALTVERELGELKKSGPAGGDLTSAALRAVESWKGLPGVSSHGEMGEFRCYQAGCSATFTSPDAASAHMIGEAVTRSESFWGWPAPKFRSGAVELPSGHVQTTFILFRNASGNDPKEQP
jgi:hypothetical protein